MTSHTGHAPSSFASIAQQQAKASAFTCLMPSLQATDGKVYALLKPLEQVRLAWTDEQSLASGLQQLYENIPGAVRLVKYTAKNESGKNQIYDAILFSGEDLVKKFTEEFAAHAAKAGRGKGAD